MFSAHNVAIDNSEIITQIGSIISEPIRFKQIIKQIFLSYIPISIEYLKIINFHAVFSTVQQNISTK